MDKETEGIEKESDGSRTLLANFEQDTPAFPGTTNSLDPARALRMSDSFFVSDTLDEDESIIPPTQELLIPSTPPSERTTHKDEDSSKLNDTTLSNLDETCFENLKQGDDVKPEEAQVQVKEKEVIDITSQNDLTQDLMDLDATQELLVQKPDPAQYTREVQEVNVGDDDDDDEWNLRFTDTQETQELSTSSKLRESDNINQMSTIAEEEPIENAPKETNTPPVEIKVDSVVPSKPEEKEEDDESEDEIAPSQSCLEDYQADTHLTYLERMSQNSTLDPPPSHSTPDASSNGKPPAITKSCEILNTPSPIPLKPTSIVEDVSNIPPSPAKPTTEELQADSSFELPAKKSEEPEAVVEKDVVLEQCSTPEPAKFPETITISQEEKGNEEKSKIPSETIDLASSTDQTVVGIDVPEVPEVASKVSEKVEEEREEKKPEVASEEQEKVTNAYISKITAVNEKQSVENSDDNKITLPDTEPNFRLPLPRGSFPRKPRLQRAKKSGQALPAQAVSEKKLIGKFQDISSFKQLLKKTVEEQDFNQENLETLMSLKPDEEMEANLHFCFSVKNNSVSLSRTFEICHPNESKIHPDVSVSPHSGSSSSLATVNSNHSSANTSLPSGEMADLSSFSSGKSLSNPDTTAVLSSQDPPKTSTQTSSAPSTSFSKIFATGAEVSKGEDPEDISPIKPTPATRGRRGRKPASAAAAVAVEKPQPTAKRRRGRTPKAKVEEKAVLTTTDSEVEKPIPKRKKKEKKKSVPEVIPEEISSLEDADMVSDKNEDVNTGVRVMARWQDGYFYPGLVKCQDSESKWQVEFEDNQVKKIPQENLIRVSILAKGTSVLVQSEEEYYDPGIITGHFREGNVNGYDVELDSGSIKRFPRAKVILSTDQAKMLPGYRPLSTQATTINLDNLVTGKRKRKSAQSPEQHVSKKPTRTSGRLSKTESNLESADESEKGAEPGPSTSTATISTGRSRRRTAPTSFKDSGSKDSKLFKDFAFILSTTEKRPPPKSYDSEPCSADDFPIPFDKGEICSRITPRGGIILDSFEDVQKCKRKHIYLLADTYLRTMKYIQCLTVGIPCVRHHWVYDCCFKKEILTLSSYTLPAGFSIITNQIVEWHGKSSVLKGKKIFLVSAPDSSFVYTWSPVLVAAEAKIVKKLTATTAKSGVDVIVSNNLCPADVLKTAKLKKLPVVSSEWVIQSLIIGRVLQYDEHPRFRHDFNND